MLLSLIIPVYKVEQYIEECIESVCKQLCNGVEVIIVNDGSPDQSMNIAKQHIYEKYGMLISQFVFLNQKNQGQSIARNNALKVAKGKYVAFLDSDDYLLDNYFSTIISEVKKNSDIDVIHFNAKQFNDEKKIYIDDLKIVNSKQYITINSNYRKKIFEDSQWYPWLRILKRELFDNVEFEPNVYMEDKLLFPEMYSKNNLKTILELNCELICYRHRIGSSIRSGYNSELMNGIEMGLKKFSTNEYEFYSIVYTQFLMQKISIIAAQGFSILEIYKIIIEKRTPIDLKLSFSIKAWLLKRMSMFYATLLILRKR